MSPTTMFAMPNKSNKQGGIGLGMVRQEDMDVNTVILAATATIVATCCMLAIGATIHDWLT
jgi:hypothetical protein